MLSMIYAREAAQMIKQDLIQRVVERTGLPRTKAEDAVDAIFDSMKKTLIAGDRIELRGFGVFTVKPRKTGIGRNPRTGTEGSIAPGKAVRFKPCKELHLLDNPAYENVFRVGRERPCEGALPLVCVLSGQ